MGCGHDVADSVGNTTLMGWYREFWKEEEKQFPSFEKKELFERFGVRSCQIWFSL